MYEKERKNYSESTGLLRSANCFRPEGTDHCSSKTSVFDTAKCSSSITNHQKNVHNPFSLQQVSNFTDIESCGENTDVLDDREGHAGVQCGDKNCLQLEVGIHFKTYETISDEDELHAAIVLSLDNGQAALKLSSSSVGADDATTSSLFQGSECEIGHVDDLAVGARIHPCVESL